MFKHLNYLNHILQRSVQALRESELTKDQVADIMLIQIQRARDMLDDLREPEEHDFDQVDKDYN